MKDYAKGFYLSPAWKKTREAYRKSKGNLCEPCLENGIIKPCEFVHHKIHISPENITNPEITLDWNNLQCVCRDCHAKLHGTQKRYQLDEEGRIVWGD